MDYIFFATGEKSILARFVKECLDDYWNKHKYSIDYLFLDCIIYLGYEMILSVKEEINMIPENNVDVFEAMYSFERMDEDISIIRDLKRCKINKLTYKVNYEGNQIKLMENVLSKFE